MNVVGKKRGKEYKHALNFEIKDDANPEKIINKRLLHELSTTSNNPSTSNDSSSSLILSLTEGRGQARGEVGIAALHIDSPYIILCQLSDGIHYTDTLNKIQVLNPSKILLPDTIFETVPLPKLIELIKENFPDIAIIPVQRRHFNDKYGFDQISKLCSRKSFNILQIISRKYYCLSSAAALLSYLKNVALMNFAESCLKVDYQTKGGMMVDTQTSVRLELLYSLNTESSAAKKFSLYDMLNKCETRIGQRHLRANILEPSCDIEFIEKRHEQIKILIDNEDAQASLKESLKNFRLVESLLKISCITPVTDLEKAVQTNINLTLLLKNNLEAVKPLAVIVSELSSEAFEDAQQLLSSDIFNDLIEKINQLVQPNIHENRLAQKHYQYLYAVRSNCNETIDFLRQIYSETVDKIRVYVDDLIEKSLLPIKLIHSTKLGYHLVLKCINNSLKVPESFETIYKKGNNIYLTTAELITYNDKTMLISNDLIRLSNNLLCDLLLEAAKEIDAIYHLIGVVIDLDIAQSLAEIAKIESFCCPTFTRVLRLEDAYHPMLQGSRNKVDVIKNNAIATPQYNFYLITGPNMSGKTVYIKMIAVIQIMAQIGSFLPAKTASIRLCDKIFSRLGFQDNIEQNASSFSVELRDMDYIYNNITPNSLVIMDELCRSTDPQEGEALCYAFCEKLLSFIGISYDHYFQIASENDSAEANKNNGSKNSSSLNIKGADIKLKDIARPFIFLTTHFSELTKLTEKPVD
ncbi:mutS protein homolog 4-like isoform X2 [Chironomus tepperi]|uniref:mutS protein homolog 4-like isoform X2 n=1 Tax=Chironomus tepperi TaxID=113505 RepID=UPI00391F2FBE